MKLSHRTLLIFILLFSSHLAFSTHFRTGKIEWTVTPGTRTVNFKVTSSWRDGASEPIYLYFGDGSVTGALTGTQVLSVPNDYGVFEATVSHTYANDGPFIVNFSDCCRISTLQNFPDDNLVVSAKVCLANGNTGSPIINAPTVIEMSNSGNNTFQLPVSDPDGTPLTYSTSPISGNTYVPSNGSNLASISQTGLISWNTAGLVIGRLYLFKIKISDGCSEVESEYIIKIVSCPPIATGTISGSTNIYQGSTANLTITFTGIGPWTYRLSGTNTDVTTSISPVTIPVNPLSTTTYTLLSVTGNDGSCGSALGSATVSVSCEPIATITGTTSINSGQTTNLNVSFSGIGPWTYRLSGTTTDVTTSTSPITIPVTPSLSTTYSLLSVSNSSGFCGTSTGSAVVTVNCPAVATISGTTIINSGQTTNLTITFSGTGPWSYRLSGSSTDISTATSPVTIPVTPGSSTTYSLSQVTHSGGFCATASGSATVTVVCPAVATVSGTTSVISGQTTNVSIAFTGTPPWTYRLSGTSTDVSTSTTPIIIPVTLNSSNTYTISNVTHAGGYCATATGSAAISVTCPTVATISGTKTILKGESADLTLTFTGTGPWTYRLSGSNTDVTTQVSPVTITVTPTTSTTYTLTNITHNGGYCAYANGGATITVVCPVTATISGSNTINRGQSTPLTISFTETGPWTYRINGINTNFTTSNNPVTIPVAPNVSTNYTLSSVSNSCGFGTVSGNANINVIVPVLLQACYSFNGNANDGKGLNHGTVLGATLTTDRFGNPNSAYNFNGVNNYISLPDNTLGFPEYTYSAWVNTNSILEFSQTILSIGYLGGDQVLALSNLLQTNGNQQINFFSHIYYNAQPIPQILSNSSNLLNQWHQITCTRSLNDLKLYFDGMLIASTPSGGLPPFYSTPIKASIGVRSRNDIQFFNGKIDDVKIYDGALTDEEVAFLYLEESGPNMCSDFCSKFLYTKTSGNWNDSSIWSCGRIPTSSDVVLIKTGHIVEVDNIIGNAKGIIMNGNINMQNGGNVSFGQTQPISQSFISQPDAVSGKDGIVSSGNSNTNYATSYYSTTCAWTNNGPFVNRSLVSFDLSSIPSNAIVDSAFLNMYFNQTYADISPFLLGGHYGDNAMYFQKITQAWDENTVTWVNQPTSSSQNQSEVPAATSNTQNYRVNVKPLVSEMVANPTTNFGFMIKLQNESIYRFTIFSTSDETNPNLRPKIEVYYHLP